MIAYFVNFIYLGLAFLFLYVGAKWSYRSHVDTVRFFLPYLSMSGLVFAIFFSVSDILSLFLPDIIVFLLAFAVTFSGIAWWKTHKFRNVASELAVLLLSSVGFFVWGLTGCLFSAILPTFIHSITYFVAPVCGGTAAFLSGILYKSLPNQKTFPH